MKQFVLLVLTFVCATACQSQTYTATIRPNELIACHDDSVRIDGLLVKFAPARNLQTGDLVVKIGKQLLGLPYVPHTLENGTDEKLVINLRELDCTTFDETCLALAFTLKNGGNSFTDYAFQLQKIRYRNGIRDGYLSRLHYFSDWLYNNQEKGLISLVDSSFQTPWQKAINFMSTHPNSYERLKENPKLISQLTEQEDEISNRKFFFLPKNEIKASEKELKNGDIVAITTNIAGLDVVHVGFVVWVDGRVHLLHASSALAKVVISEEPLADYLAVKKSFTGIMLARPNEHISSMPASTKK